MVPFPAAVATFLRCSCAEMGQAKPTILKSTATKPVMDKSLQVHHDWFVALIWSGLCSMRLILMLQPRYFQLVFYLISFVAMVQKSQNGLKASSKIAFAQAFHQHSDAKLLPTIWEHRRWRTRSGNLAACACVLQRSIESMSMIESGRHGNYGNSIFSYGRPHSKKGKGTKALQSSIVSI